MKENESQFNINSQEIILIPNESILIKYSNSENKNQNFSDTTELVDDPFEFPFICTIISTFGKEELKASLLE